MCEGFLLEHSHCRLSWVQVEGRLSAGAVRGAAEEKAEKIDRFQYVLKDLPSVISGAE